MKQYDLRIKVRRLVCMSETMQYRQLGKSGLTVSTIGVGCNNLGRFGTITEQQEGVDRVISAAVDAGITLFDVADIYGKEPGLSETMFGASLKKLGSAARDNICLLYTSPSPRDRG